MASFRRTLSPARHDRHHFNGAAAASFSPHKFFHNAKYSSTAAPHSRLLFSSALFNLGRKGWRRSLFRLLIFFAAGFLFGMFPFGHMDAGGPKKDFAFTDFERPTVNQTFTSVSLGIDLKKMEVVQDEEDRRDREPRKQLIVVTPTYNRLFQAYFLNRLGHVLRLVKPPLLWIVVEDKTASFETAEILRKIGVVYRHLVSSRNSSDVKDRGVHQRNAALEHIELHRLDGIIYFADDDNIYSTDLFESLRSISRFGTWPVAMLAQSKNKAVLEGPVCNGSQVTGWHTNEKSKRFRRFHVDMSGFAFNSTILWDPKRWRRPFLNPIRQLDTVKEGFQETTFIEQVVEDESQMEGTPSGCSKILNWHLHLDTKNLAYPKGWRIQKTLNTILPIQ